LLGFVQGRGTTTNQSNYSFKDEILTSGIYSYRLKQIDFDGSSEYSNEVSVDVELPTDFILEQNYPNPFNPSTTISFSLPESADVSLTIYNALGQKVTELVNSKLEAGRHSYEWNVPQSGITSGMYIYELRTNDFASIKKMILLK
jgi:hypothetical protein